METIIVVVIIAAAAAYTVWSLYRSTSVKGKKSCGCEDGCPISERCSPDDDRCVVTEDGEEVVR